MSEKEKRNISLIDTPVSIISEIVPEIVLADEKVTEIVEILPEKTEIVEIVNEIAEIVLADEKVTEIVKNLTEKITEIVTEKSENSEIVTEIAEIVLNVAVDKIIDNSTKNDDLYSIIFSVLNNVNEKDIYDKILADIMPKTQICSDIKQVIYDFETLAKDSSVNDIYKCILEIVKDDKIDSKDIPQFILLVERTHKLIVNLKDKEFQNKSRIEITELFIKFTFHVLVEKGIIGVPDRKREFLKEIDALIDACIRLLNFPVDLKIKPKNLFQNIKKYLCFRK